MTLCIAAIANEYEDEIRTRIYFCSDARVETYSVGSETEYKLQKVDGAWAVMFAGNIGRANELIRLYISYFQELASTNLAAITIDHLRVPPQQLKRTLVNEHVSNTIGLTYDEFLLQSQQLPPAVSDNLWSELQRIQIGCQLILIPIQTTETLFSVQMDGSVHLHRNFCTIGSGSTSADAWLHYREQQPLVGHDRTAVHLLEAKRFAETAPGVGKLTHLSMLDQNKIYSQFMDSEKDEARSWKTFGPRSTEGKSITISKPSPTPWDELSTG